MYAEREIAEKSKKEIRKMKGQQTVECVEKIASYFINKLQNINKKMYSQNKEK